MCEWQGAWWWVDQEESHAPTHPRQQVVDTYFDLSNAFLSDAERTYGTSRTPSHTHTPPHTLTRR
jgi:hypothetical protein